MWTRELAKELGSNGPDVLAINPRSLLATKMVKEGFGVSGNDIGIGADILVRAALSEEFSGRSGGYFDNDSGRFSDPHPGALSGQKSEDLVAVIEALINDYVIG
ncbi:hypothetical protein [Roseibium sp.]|uniref:hypothetical protein n=1 Tax=Roseibium sp. TaxID=1936156 RepID=UPI003B51A7E5